LGLVVVTVREVGSWWWDLSRYLNIVRVLRRTCLWGNPTMTRLLGLLIVNMRREVRRRDLHRPLTVVRGVRKRPWDPWDRLNYLMGWGRMGSTLIGVERLRSVLFFIHSDRCGPAWSRIIQSSAEIKNVCPFVMAGDGRSWSGWVDIAPCIEFREIREIGDVGEGRRRMVGETWRHWSASTVSRLVRIARPRIMVWRGLGLTFLVRVMFWSGWSRWSIAWIIVLLGWPWGWWLRIKWKVRSRRLRNRIVWVITRRQLGGLGASSAWRLLVWRTVRTWKLWLWETRRRW